MTALGLNAAELVIKLRGGYGPSAWRCRSLPPSDDADVNKITHTEA